jgi:hypothetical protein
MSERTNRCPKCGGEAVPIVYGLVPFILGGPKPTAFLVASGPPPRLVLLAGLVWSGA